eukprot:3536097-Rhodomonas_salina.2
MQRKATSTSTTSGAQVELPCTQSHPATNLSPSHYHEHMPVHAVIPRVRARAALRCVFLTRTGPGGTEGKDSCAGDSGGPAVYEADG